MKEFELLGYNTIAFHQSTWNYIPEDGTHYDKRFCQISELFMCLDETKEVTFSEGTKYKEFTV